MSRRSIAITAPGAVLSQPTRQIEPVERLAAADELDRVRDHLTAHERRAHAGSALRQVVGDGDRVELERRPAGGAHTRGDMLGERALAEVARHRARPRRRDPDERAAQVTLVETHRAQVGARSGAPRARGEVVVREPVLHRPILETSPEYASVRTAVRRRPLRRVAGFACAEAGCARCVELSVVLGERDAVGSLCLLSS